MKHAFTKDILLINDAFNGSKELIKVAETINSYKAAGVANSENPGYESDIRTNSTLFLNPKHPQIQPHVEVLNIAIEEAKKIYAHYNKYLYASKNFGYDLLKYTPGQYFVEHVDLIPGHEVFKNRQLSILVYLNDTYCGGETYFPRQEVQLKPPTGSIALFPPFYTHPHTSLPIVDNTSIPVEDRIKYVVVNWLYS